MDHSQLENLIEEKFPLFVEASEKLWDYAELAWQEVKSVACQCELLAAQGFTITRLDDLDMPTAFIAQWGSGHPIIGFLGEYDSLPRLSQEAFVAHEAPEADKSAGHGCGHNLLGTAAMEAAVAAKDYMERNGLAGTIRYYGCPAEEHGCGKAFMVRGGCFKDVDACFTWHPGPGSYTNMRSLANISARFSFKGISAHAALAPHVGRSALDAVELMNVGANFLREHVTDDVRIAYAITNAGGKASNIIPANAEVEYGLRSNSMDAVKDVLRRITKIAEGAALMTETTMECKVISSYADLILNDTLTELTRKSMERVFPLPFTQEELDFAQSFREIAPPAEVAEQRKDAQRYGGNPERPMMDFAMPPEAMGHLPSTDAGDVSWNVPTSCCTVCVTAMGTPLHNWRTTAQDKSPTAHRGMKGAATIMAMSALSLVEDPQLVKRAREDFEKALAGRKYECVIPDEVKPGQD